MGLLAVSSSGSGEALMEQWYSIRRIDSASCAGMSNWEANFQIMFVLVQNFMGSGGVDSMQILYCSSCELILIIYFN